MASISLKINIPSTGMMKTISVRSALHTYHMLLPEQYDIIAIFFSLLQFAHPFPASENRN